MPPGAQEAGAQTVGHFSGSRCPERGLGFANDGDDEMVAKSGLLKGWRQR